MVNLELEQIHLKIDDNSSCVNDLLKVTFGLASGFVCRWSPVIDLNVTPFVIASSLIRPSDRQKAFFFRRL